MKVLYRNTPILEFAKTSGVKSTLMRLLNLKPSEINLFTFSNPPLEPQEQLKANTDIDGGIFGVRYFQFARPNYLLSPTSFFVWETNFAIADDFSNSDAVRNHIGFHAAWCELKTWPFAYVDHDPTAFKALVKGYGDIVVGQTGWRSEKLRIEAIAGIQEDRINKLKTRYPAIEFTVQPHTNEQYRWLIKSVTCVKALDKAIFTAKYT